MNLNEQWDNTLAAVKKTYADATKIINAEGVTQTCAAITRMTIEGLVKLFYLKFYRKPFDERFKLAKAIKHDDFRKHFTGAEWADIDFIRFVGNEEIHFLFKNREEIINRFNKAVKVLQEKLNITVIPEPDIPSDPSKTVRKGQIFDVNTNAELLNTVLGTKLEGWMKCGWLLTVDKKYELVMLAEAKIINGWTNRFEEPEGLMYEDFVELSNEKLPRHEGFPPLYRAVFKKCTERRQRYYIFAGVYELLLEKSTPEHRISKRIAETEDFSKYPPYRKPMHKL